MTLTPAPNSALTKSSAPSAPVAWARCTRRATRAWAATLPSRVQGAHNERFEQEARAIASLNHHAHLPVYDVGPNYLVMEYVDGAPILTKDKPVPWPRCRALALQICDALEAAHKKNITHRDLKPGNILMTASGVKLLDFGLAKVSGCCRGRVRATADHPLTAAGTVLGTAAYMSPEQAKGRRPTRARISSHSAWCCTSCWRDARVLAIALQSWPP